MADIKSQSNDSTEVSLRKAVDLLGNIEDKTNNLVVGELEVKNTSGDPLSVQGTVTALASTGINHPVTSFTVSTKTILIANFPNAPVIGNFLLITNTTRGVTVHNSGDPQKICTFGSPSYNGQFFSITATFPASVDTAGMQNSDTFHVVYAPVAIGNPLASQVELVGRTQSGGTSKAEMSAAISGALLVDTGTGSLLGAVNESAATTDTATSGINGLLKRLLQKIYPPFVSGSFTNGGGASTGIDCGGYDYLVQHISGGGGGYNRPIQWSYDNVNWTHGGVVFKHISGGSSSMGNEAHWTVMGDILGTSSGIFVIPVVGRYFRIGASGINGGGSWTHNWYLHKGPFPGLVEEGIGARNSSAATTDTSDVGLNGLFKRLLQRLTTLLPANLTVSSTRLLVDGSGVTQPVSGTVTSLAGGETPTSGTATLTNDTRWELNTEGFGHIAIEVVSTATVWGPSGIVAQAYNGTAPSNTGILAPAGIRYRHPTDTGTLNQTLNNFYYNLNISPNVANAYGTSLVWIDGNNTASLALAGSGVRYFLFDLTTSRFALRPFFSSGTVTINYRLYRDKHPFFSARNIIATGKGSSGAVEVQPVGTGNVYVDGGYLDSGTISIVNAIADGDGNILGLDRHFPVDVQNTVIAYPQQGSTVSNTNFTSATSATLASAVAFREVLTVHNEGPATLFINAGTSASTTSYQVRLLAGDYWEAPAGQQSMQHSGIFSSAGSTARVTEIS